MRGVFDAGDTDAFVAAVRLRFGLDLKTDDPEVLRLVSAMHSRGD